MVNHELTISILTKSELISRDIDIMKKFHNIEVGISVSTINIEYMKQPEPRASIPIRRFEALKKCKETGLKTYVFFSPIFPYITNLEEIMKLAVNFTDYFMFENLNVRPTNRKRIFNFEKKINLNFKKNISGFIINLKIIHVGICCH